jgi:hypothetical protein
LCDTSQRHDLDVISQAFDFIDIFNKQRQRRLHFFTRRQPAPRAPRYAPSGTITKLYNSSAFITARRYNQIANAE